MEVVDINNELSNNRNIEIGQKSFLENDIGKVINSALDIGLKAALPNLIEDQVIDIKNVILEQGFSEGIKEAISKGIELGKSVSGIVTGNFDNISQIQLAVKNGGIIDNISKLLDLSINLAKSKKLITQDVANLVKKGKNTVINSISNKIEESLTNQIKGVEKLEKYCIQWNTAYKNRDFSEMEKSYKNIKTNLNNVIPLEKTLIESRKIENLHNLIKNNGGSFNITENEKKLAEKLS